jgi:hypothetical protein
MVMLEVSCILLDCGERNKMVGSPIFQFSMFFLFFGERDQGGPRDLVPRVDSFPFPFPSPSLSLAFSLAFCYFQEELWRVFALGHGRFHRAVLDRVPLYYYPSELRRTESIFVYIHITYISLHIILSNDRVPAIGTSRA